MASEKSAGVTRRNVLKTAAWSAPVLASVTAIPLAAASVAPEITAWFVTTCGGRDRLTLFITNHTSEALEVFADVDMDGDGAFEAGDGFTVAPDETQSFGYGLYANGTPTYRVFTARQVYLEEKLTVDCPPLGLTAWITSEIENGTNPVMFVHMQNETASPMQTYIDLDWDGDGVPDSGDGPILAPNEYQVGRYDLWFNEFGVTVRNELGYALNTRVGFGEGV